MSTNLSLKRRNDLIKTLNYLKTKVTSNEMLSKINLIEEELTKKKYGLLWEEHEERVDQELKTKIPVFIEDKEKEIVLDKNKNINFLIEGDNLHSLYMLEKTHKNSIDMIYIDPPYNTGKKDFIYNDKIVNEDDDFRHSKWISFMHNRLVLAKKLLSYKGVIFISIDDNEQAQLKLLCDEIFGEENFVAMLSVENNPKGRKNSNFISVSNEYCLIYAKNKVKSSFIENIPKNIDDVVKDEKGNFIHNSGKRVLVGENSFNDYVEDFQSDKHYVVYYNSDIEDIKFRKEKEISEIDKQLIEDGYQRYYSYNNNRFVLNTYTFSKLQELFEEGSLEFKNGKIYEKNFNTTIRLKSLIVNREYKGIVNNKAVNVKIDVKTTSAGTELKKIFNSDNVPFSNPKNVGLIKLLITLFEDKNITVLDFFAGSGTTAQAVLEQNREDGGNRKFILCTNNEIPQSIAKEYALEKGYISNKREFNKFTETDKYIDMCKETELQNKGICRAITYQRIKTIMTGIRVDNTKYSDGIPSNLKYYKTGYIDRYSLDEDLELSDELIKYMKELVILENNDFLESSKIKIIFKEQELEKVFENLKEIEKIYLYSDILLTIEQEDILDSLGIEIIEIPEYYYRNEIEEI